MKKINSNFGLAVLGLAMLVASCARAPIYSGSIPMGLVGTAAKTVAPKSPKDGGRQSLTLRAKVTSGGYRALALPEAYTRSSINHLVVKLFTYMGGVETPVLDSQGEQVQADVAAANLDAPLTFTNLKANTTYRVRAYAYKGTGLATSDLISVASNSYVDVSVGNDEQPTMGTLRVKLMDVVSDGATSNTSVEITDGTVIHSGTEHIVVGSPAPTPSSTPSSGLVSLVPALSESNMDGYRVRHSGLYGLKAFDGVLGGNGELWIEGPNSGSYLELQLPLGKLASLSDMELVSRSGGYLTQSPRDFHVQGTQDGVNWTTLKSVTGQTAWRENERRTYSVASTSLFSRFRLVVDANDGDFFNTVLTEMALKGHFADRVTPLPKLSSMFDQGYTVASTGGDAWKLFDGVMGGDNQQWVAYESNGMWVSIELPTGKSLLPSGFEVVSRSGGYTDQSPRDFRLQGLNAGGTWTNLAVVTGQTSWAENERRYFPVTTTEHFSKFRLFVDSNDGAIGYTVFTELQIFGSMSS